VNNSKAAIKIWYSMENSGHPVILKNFGVNEQGIVLQDSDL
jgi:hypothetical protein